jgi:hypothetical protein
MLRREEEPAPDGPQLLGDRRAEHESRITDRNGQVATGHELPARPRDLGPRRNGG